MYDFAIVALLALATIKLVDFVVDLLPMREEMFTAARSVLTFASAFGAVWILDYSVFAGWGIAVRNDTLGVWMTGFLVAGATVGWRAVFRFLTQNSSTSDEPLGEHSVLRRVA